MDAESKQLLNLQLKSLESMRKFIAIGDFSETFVNDFSKSLDETINDIKAELGENEDGI